MITRINHIGIAVSSIDQALKLYTEVLGLSLKEIEVVEEQRVRTAILPVGESKIELLESTDPEGPLARHIEKFGEGIHHLALEVADIEEALSKVAQSGLPLIDEKPRQGVAETRIAFLHPKGTGRVLLELVQS
ncbi:Ethylmalonyl-CoA/methylmalonyl-CoA epimerase [subsurface metagenome]|jgi:methylmalonyl-CoA/ethylmalonyl-CoA epimerase|nr:methylmalonyl-CoA epimerase [Dehalococcoidia bacterium]